MFALSHRHRLVVEVVRVAYTIQAAHGRYDNDVPPAAHQGRCGTDPELVNLVVDAQVFFYISIGHGNIGLRLIIIIIGDEVLYGILREESFEFAVQLGCEGFVMAQDQGRTLKPLNDVGHGKGFAGAGYAQQRNILYAFL